MEKLFLLYLFVFGTVVLATASLNLVKTGNDLKVKNWGLPLAGHKLMITPLATDKAKNSLQCMSKCTKTEGCISINVGPNVEEEHVCEMLGFDKYVMMFNMTVDPEWTYIGIKTKCDKNPCRTEEMCIPNYGNDNYNCIGAEDTSCQHLLEKGIVSSGLFLVNLAGTFTPVYCDQVTDGGGWLVIQRRRLGVDFSKTWQDYKKGFGNLLESFWCGNEKIHQITSTGDYNLRIDLTQSTGVTGYGMYAQFKLSSEQDDYRLQLDPSSFTGTIGDSLSSDNADAHLIGKSFVTTDRDNSHSCATLTGGGWWFGHCARGSLNANIFEWRSWANYQLTVLSEMKIRPVTV